MITIWVAEHDGWQTLCECPNKGMLGTVVRAMTQTYVGVKMVSLPKGMEPNDINIQRHGGRHGW